MILINQSDNKIIVKMLKKYNKIKRLKKCQKEITYLDSCTCKTYLYIIRAKVLLDVLL